MNAKQNPWQQGLHIFVIELDFFSGELFFSSAE
jgi:hypothetical protein